MFGVKKDRKRDPRSLLKVTDAEKFLNDPMMLREAVNLGYTREQIAVLLGSCIETALMALYYEAAVERNLEKEKIRPHVAYLEKTVSAVMRYKKERYQDDELTPEECYKKYTATVDSSHFFDVMVHAAEVKAGHRIDRKAFEDGSTSFFKTQMKHLVTEMYKEKMAESLKEGENKEEDLSKVLTEKYTEDFIRRNKDRMGKSL